MTKGTTNSSPAPQNRAAEEVSEVLESLRAETQVTRARIRRMGQIAESLGIERRSTDSYEFFLNRILKTLTKEKS